MSWMEILVIVFVFLVVLGPKEILPSLLLVVRLFRKIYRMTHSIKEEINALIHEVEAQDYSERSRQLAHEKEPLVEGDWESSSPFPLPEPAHRSTPRASGRSSGRSSSRRDSSRSSGEPSSPPSGRSSSRKAASPQ